MCEITHGQIFDKETSISLKDAVYYDNGYMISKATGSGLQRETLWKTSDGLWFIETTSLLTDVDTFEKVSEEIARQWIYVNCYGESESYFKKMAASSLLED